MATSRSADQLTWSVRASKQNLVTLTINSKNKSFFYSTRGINQFCSSLLLHFMRQGTSVDTLSLACLRLRKKKRWVSLGPIASNTFRRSFRLHVPAPVRRGQEFNFCIQIKDESREHDSDIPSQSHGSSSAVCVDQPVYENDSSTLADAPLLPIG